MKLYEITPSSDSSTFWIHFLSIDGKPLHSFEVPLEFVETELGNDPHPEPMALAMALYHHLRAYKDYLGADRAKNAWYHYHCSRIVVMRAHYEVGLQRAKDEAEHHYERWRNATEWQRYYANKLENVEMEGATV
jgi:hypothetical protein